MTMQLTAFFVGTAANTGWTETYYDTSATYAAALTKADAVLRPPRLGILSAAYALRQFRVSDPTINRDSQVKAYSQAQGVGFVPLGTDPGDWGAGSPQALPPSAALLLRCEAGALNRRMFLLRGMSLSFFGADNVYNPAPAGVAAVNLFNNMLTTAPYQIRTISQGAPGFPSSIGIGANGFLITIIFPNNPPAGLIVNGLMKLSGFTGAAFLNGIWKVSQILQPGGAGTQTTVVPYKKKRAVYGTPLMTGQITAVNVAYSNFTNVIPLRGGKRDTGRPLGLPRGRARVHQS